MGRATRRGRVYIAVVADSLEINPAVVIRPTLLALKAASGNQRAPSGPAVMPSGRLLGASPPGGNSVMTPPVVIRPILLALVLSSVNQSAPSGPAVMPSGELFGVRPEE